MSTPTHNVPLGVSTANEAQQRLLASALSLFSEKGYEGASIREIIERAGVTRPVLYYYFENKEHLFINLVESWSDQMIADLDKNIAAVDGYRAKLSAFITTGFAHAEEATEVIGLIFHVFLSPPGHGPNLDKDKLWQLRFQRVLDIMQAGLDAGDLTGRSASTLAMAFIGMMDTYIMAKINHRETKLSNELGEALVDLFLEGAFTHS
jgi:TetR/AcrR family transcriptional regulator